MAMLHGPVYRFADVVLPVHIFVVSGVLLVPDIVSGECSKT